MSTNSTILDSHSTSNIHIAKIVVRIIFGTLFIAASTFHFTKQEEELSIIPPFLPWRRAALYITGVLEFIGGLGLFLPRFKRSSGLGLAALLVVIFPANIFHTVKDIQAGTFTKTRFYHLFRFPLQGVLIWLVAWCSNDQ